MARTSDRLGKTYSQGTMNVMKIWIDKTTGINYPFHVNGYAGGLTPPLDREGKSMVLPVVNS